MFARLAAVAIPHVIAGPHVPTECHVDAPARDRAVPELLAPGPTGTVTGMNIFGITERNRIRAVFTSITIKARQAIF